MSLFGVFLFRAVIAPAVLRQTTPEAGRQLNQRLGILALASLAVALASAVIVVIWQAAAMSGARDLASIARAITPVVSQTRFGNMFLGNIVLLLATAFCMRRGAMEQRRVVVSVSMVLAGAAIICASATGHMAVEEDGDHLVATLMRTLHFLAAGAWLGSLAPLLCTMSLPAPAAYEAAKRFSPIGITCVAVLTLTAWSNAEALIGSVPALLGTQYGHWALIKLLLFMAMVAFAIQNRLELTPQLLERDPVDAAWRLRRNVSAEIALGLMVTLAAGILASIPPGVHAQAWWPLPFRLSFAALVEQPELFGSFSIAVVVAALGVAITFSGFLYRKWRLASFAAGFGLVFTSVPWFKPLAVDAYPTTYWRSPSSYSAEGLAQGARAFDERCRSCHTLGMNARSSSPGVNQPTDLVTTHLADHFEGDTFWKITNGTVGGGMPAFATTLDESTRWSLIDLIHATIDASRLPGSATKISSRLPRAPSFDVECPDGAIFSARDLDGRAMHVVFAGPRSTERLNELAVVQSTRRTRGIVTVVAGNLPNSLAGTFCEVITPQVDEAYAVLRGPGEAASAMDGTEFLIDRAGRLRAVRRNPNDPDWVDPIVRPEIDNLLVSDAAPRLEHHGL
jgi:putative copper export protein/mono/diheme cytochrome c family protein